MMMRPKNPLIIAAIKWVLDEDFIDNADWYCVSTDICSRFVASLLDFGLAELLALQLTKALFSQDYLGGLEDVVAYHVPFRGLPLASDLRHFITFGDEVTWHPLISSLRTMTLSSHRFRAKLVAEFLLRVHMIVPVLDGTEWHYDFRDYIFPRVLMPHIQPNLVVIYMAKVLDGNHDHEWSEGDGTPDDSADPNFQVEDDEDEEDQ